MKNKILSYSLILGLIVCFAASARSQGPRYTAWSPLAPVNAVNTPGVELNPSITHDGLTLYFFRGGDIYVSHRPNQNADWGIPEPLQSPVNLPAPIIENAPFESTDKHWLFFMSTRPGGVGGFDIWVSYRKFVHDDYAWEEPVNLRAVNSEGFEGGPMLYEDEMTGIKQLYFASTPVPGGQQSFADIFVSTFGPSGFGTPVPVSVINSEAHDGRPWVRRDGLEMFFESYRDGLPNPFSFGSIYSSTRWSINQPWSSPTVVIGRSAPGYPGDRWITTPSLSRDGLTLFVAVNQPGTDIGDIYVAHRQKLTGNQ